MLPITPTPQPGLTSVTFAKDQPQYIPLPALIDGNYVLTQWQMTWADRLRALFTGRIHLAILTFGQPLQPVKLSTQEQY